MVRWASLRVLAGVLTLCAHGFSSFADGIHQSGIHQSGIHQPSCQLTPYDASYTLDLADDEESLSVVNGEGTMTQTLREHSNGWTFRQEANLNVSFTSPDSPEAHSPGASSLGPEEGQQPENKQGLDFLEEGDPNSTRDKQKIHWVYTLWEAKNGRLMRFIWQRWIDGLLDENVQGEVHYEPQTASATVTYSHPHSQTPTARGSVRGNGWITGWGVKC